MIRDLIVSLRARLAAALVNTLAPTIPEDVGLEPGDVDPRPETIPMHPMTRTHCVVDPADYAEAVAGVRDDDVRAVAVKIAVGGRVGSVVFTPPLARCFAAGLLNAADAADGTVPLNFVKES